MRNERKKKNEKSEEVIELANWMKCKSSILIKDVVADSNYQYYTSPPVPVQPNRSTILLLLLPVIVADTS